MPMRPSLAMCLTFAGMAGLAVAPARAAPEEPSPPAAVDSPAPGLPFSTVDLDRALLARLVAGAGVSGPRVEPAGPGAVTVHLGDLERRVVVGDRVGPAAARIVALVIAEMLETAPAPAPAPRRARQEEPIGAVAATPASPVVPERHQAWVSLAGGLAKGLGHEELLTDTIDLDVVWAPKGRARIGPSLGLAVLPTRGAGSVEQVSFLDGTFRLLGGAGWGPVEVLAGPFLATYSIGGVTPHAGRLFGGEALGRLVAPLRPRLNLTATVRADVYANRVRVQWPDQEGFATPRIGLAIGVGLAWQWRS